MKPLGSLFVMCGIGASICGALAWRQDLALITALVASIAAAYGGLVIVDIARVRGAMRWTFEGDRPGSQRTITCFGTRLMRDVVTLSRRSRILEWQADESVRAIDVPLAFGTSIESQASEILRIVSKRFRAKESAVLVSEADGTVRPIMLGDHGKRFLSLLGSTYRSYFRHGERSALGSISISDRNSGIDSMASFGIGWTVAREIAEETGHGRGAVLWLGYGVGDEPTPLELRWVEELVSGADRALRASKRSIELTAKLAESESLNQYKTQFIAHISHDIRAPIHNIKSILTLLSEETDTPEARELVQSGLTNCRSLGELVEDVLDFTRYQSGELVACRETFDLDALVRDVNRGYSVSARVKGLSLSLVSNERVPVLADRRHVRRVLSNLISNAIKYTAYGGVTVLVSRDAGIARVDVVDTGLGIDCSRLGELFKPFNRLGRSDGTGFGLGLALSRILIRASGGELSVRSAVGDGSRFSIEVESVDQNLDEARSGRSRGAVLLADDDRDAVDSLARLLERCELEVVKAYSVSEAMRSMSEKSFDRIITDLHFSDGDGRQILAKAGELERPCPVILLTGEGRESRGKLMTLGAEAVLVKPVDLEELKTLLAPPTSR